MLAKSGAASATFMPTHLTVVPSQAGCRSSEAATQGLGTGMHGQWSRQCDSGATGIAFLARIRWTGQRVNTYQRTGIVT
jgi:hypothetical protein